MCVCFVTIFICIHTHKLHTNRCVIAYPGDDASLVLASTTTALRPHLVRSNFTPFGVVTVAATTCLPGLSEVS